LYIFQNISYILVSFTRIWKQTK